MSGDKYFITDQHSPYFLTLTVVQWVDLLCRYKIEYIHENPVRAGWVDIEEHYIYSSAVDYAGGKGLVDITLV